MQRTQQSISEEIQTRRAYPVLVKGVKVAATRPLMVKERATYFKEKGNYTTNTELQASINAIAICIPHNYVSHEPTLSGTK